MIILLVITLVFSIPTNKASHFNGGTITWAPVDPYANASTVVITITQTYAWVLSRVHCNVSIPISTTPWSSENLTCIGNCSNDGGYSARPVDILTDCISSSSSLNMMISQRSKNVTLTVGAYFTIAYRSGDWRALDNFYGASGGSWSVASLINLRRRPDGILNTPPVSSVVSPQFAIVNRTTRIKIPVYDVNISDDIRCRWAQKNSASSIDECGGVCYPSGLPQDTNLTEDCVLIFTGARPDKWYAIALQVEDFINKTSLIRMSSVPVQFLIYVIANVSCTQVPVILPLTDCYEVQVGTPVNLTLYANSYCNTTQSIINDISVTVAISFMNISQLFYSTTNLSLSIYIKKNVYWTPQTNQIGQQQFCAIAYTNEVVQSEEYCVTFHVKNQSYFCQTTTTSTSTTSQITTTTIHNIITVTTSVATTSVSTSTSTTSSTTITTTKSITSFTDRISSGSITTTKNAASLSMPNETNIPLIVGLSLSVSLIMLCCCFGCCYYYLFWRNGARRHFRDKTEAKENSQYNQISTNKII